MRVGSVAEVLEAGGARGLVVKVKVADLPRAQAVLAGAGIGVEVAGDELRVALDPTEAERVTRSLAEQGLYLTELRPDTVDLETVFLELTKDEGLGE